MLRGMAKNKEDLVEGKIYEPKQSTGGVGLGFVTHLKREKLRNAKQNKRYIPGQEDENDIFEKKDPDEMIDTEIKIGSLVCIEGGKEDGQYGKVVSIKEDVTRCEIQLTLTKTIASTVVGLIRLVSRKEYNKESKVLNRTKYDQYSDGQNKDEYRGGGDKRKDEYRDKRKDDYRDKRKDERKDDYKSRDNYRERDYRSRNEYRSKDERRDEYKEDRKSSISYRDDYRSRDKHRR